MQVFVFGVEYAEGLAKETNKPYQICKLHIGQPIQSYNGQNRISKGAGMKPDEINFVPEIYDQLSQLKLPGFVDLVIEPMPGNFRRNVVTGVRNKT